MNALNARGFVVSFVSPALTALILLACSSSNGSDAASGSSSAPSAATFCDSYCSDVTSCDKTENAQTCTDSCTNNLAALIPKMRGDVVSSIQSCLKATDCADMLADDVVSDCQNQVAASVAVSSKGSAFCNDWESAAQKCGDTLDLTSCLTAVKTFNDETIDDASTCVADACSQIQDCVNAAFGVTSSTSSGSSAPFHFFSATK